MFSFTLKGKYILNDHHINISFVILHNMKKKKKENIHQKKKKKFYYDLNVPLQNLYNFKIIKKK